MTTWFRRPAVLLGALASVIVASQIQPAALAQQPSDVPGGRPGAVSPLGDVVLKRLVDPATQVTEPTLPTEPQVALVSAVRSFSLQLGVPIDLATIKSTIDSASISDEAAGYLAILVGDLAAAKSATTHLLESISPERLESMMGREASVGSLDQESVRAVQSSAERLQQDALAAQRSFSVSLCHPLPLPPPPPLPPPLVYPSTVDPIQLWPVLLVSRIDSTSIANSSYAHDYALLIDCGGNDLYDNNAGANLLDLARGPDVLWAVHPDTPARGCEQVRDLLGTGAADLNCEPAASLLMDLGGNDTYGVRRQGDEVDKNGVVCIADPTNPANYVVRRIITAGSGLAGVGMLMDAGGDDQYIGKIGAIGTGHIGGVGILTDFLASNDATSNDSYLAIRNSQGFGFGASVGVLRDSEGDDTFDFYMPAGNLTANPPGVNPGGVVSDQDVCDAVPRHLQGVGQGGAVGVLVNVAGNDTYRTNSAKSQGFGDPTFLVPAPSVGLFVDEFGASDVYECDPPTGGTCPNPVRQNNTTILPGVGSVGLGFFADTTLAGSPW